MSAGSRAYIKAHQGKSGGGGGAGGGQRRKKGRESKGRESKGRGREEAREGGRRVS